MMLTNEICYEKVIERIEKHSIIIFVHSRKETVRTAQKIKEMALANDTIHKILKDSALSKQVLSQVKNECVN